MDSKLTKAGYEMIAQRLTAIDSEIRSIRAAIFQLSEAQQRANGQSEIPTYRTAEDFVRQPD
jgi:prefoldin subunit 5